MKTKTNLYILISAMVIVIIIFLIFTKNDVDSINTVQQNVLSVPVDVYIVKYEDKELSSSRDEKNIDEVFENVNSLWKQKADIRKIETVIVKDASHYDDLTALLSYLAENGKYDGSRINAYFAQTLHGSNGIAFPGNRIMVADETSVYDFRATSHEIGHILGLRHVAPINRLMARGVNGFELNNNEIEVARNDALKLFS